MEARAGAIEAHRELEAVDRELDDPCARPGCLDLHLLERLALERGERVGHVLDRRRELLAARQLAVGLESGLLALRPVDPANAAGREPELDDLLERLRVVLAEL